MQERKTKFRIGNYMIPVTLITKGDRIFVKCKYHKGLINEIKTMQGHRWHGFEDPPRKIWSIADSHRNAFQIEFLEGGNPYVRYDRDIVDYTPTRSLYNHQIEMVRHLLTYHYMIWAVEMGCGKTLAAIEAAEHLGITDEKDLWYVGPVSGVKAVNREISKWKSIIKPRMLTYAGLVKTIRTWYDGRAPRFVILDESSKVKNETSQRSQAALHLADAIRDEHGDDGYVIEMTGTPAPKTPVDWWHQCEVACPGFLREGSTGKFKMRLCITEERESASGGIYPHVVTWLDDESKCAVCGDKKEDHAFDMLMGEDKKAHEYKSSVNEVQYLYERMKGLVLVQFSKDCLDLPEIRYEEVGIKPTASIIRTANAIKQISPRAVTALTLLRELSDGFQYTSEKVGDVTCPNCFGKKTMEVPVPIEEPDTLIPNEVNAEDFVIKEVICDYCGGVGEVPKFEQSTDIVESPKDEYFIDDLDAHEELGRYIVWGGFTGTIDRLVEMATKEGWAVLRVDGRGYYGISATGDILNTDILLDAMDFSHPDYHNLLEEYPKLCFVGHPQAGGMALTLTASPTALFFSNSFDGEARMQAEKRFHRAGMDVNRGCIIKDLIHLPTDKLVLDNLKLKKKLQSISMGDLEIAMKGL